MHEFIGIPARGIGGIGALEDADRIHENVLALEAFSGRDGIACHAIGPFGTGCARGFAVGEENHYFLRVVARAAEAGLLATVENALCMFQAVIGLGSAARVKHIDLRFKRYYIRREVGHHLAVVGACKRIAVPIAVISDFVGIGSCEFHKGNAMLGIGGCALVCFVGGIDEAVHGGFQRVEARVYDFVELGVPPVGRARFGSDALPRGTKETAFFIAPRTPVVVVDNLVIGSPLVEIIDLARIEVVRIHLIVLNRIAVHLTIHRAGNVQHKHDVQRLAGYGKGIGS